MTSPHGTGSTRMQRIRLLLAKLPDEERAVVVAGVDETVWEHADETLWQDERGQWPDEYEWREVWVEIIAEELSSPFDTFTVRGWATS